MAPPQGESGQPKDAQEAEVRVWDRGGHANHKDVGADGVEGDGLAGRTGDADVVIGPVGKLRRAGPRDVAVNGQVLGLEHLARGRGVAAGGVE